VGWDALDRWGQATRVKPLTGGVRNELWLITLDGRPAVARLGKRSDEDLAWEAGLLLHLEASGLSVPAPIPTEDGRHHVEGITVMPFVEGHPPESPHDWQAVASYLNRLHHSTPGWPQRPGWAASVDLLTIDHGTSVDLRAMPNEAVARCRAAWSRLHQTPTCVVHGDPNPGNVMVFEGRITLIDWDEARVDVPQLDLDLPFNAASLTDDERWVVSQAASAWEAAVCWQAEPEYASRRLAEVTG
jgi:Ser/Thr protein kinase RdoA (MazF antagonist)